MRISKPMAYFCPSTVLVRLNMLPLTRQCSGVGLPPTDTVPAATMAALLIVVLAKANCARSAQLADRLAPEAAVSCGRATRPWSPPPPQAVSVAAAMAAVRIGILCMGAPGVEAGGARTAGNR